MSAFFILLSSFINFHDGLRYRLNSKSKYHNIVRFDDGLYGDRLSDIASV
ncbi:hypothetical protein [Dolichospermum sp. UHCC 0259]|nr:hypothetical protein [Dolichospermum sp. UHCC 0259]